MCTYTHTHTYKEKETGKEPVRNIEKLVDPSSHFLTGENSETMARNTRVGLLLKIHGKGDVITWLSDSAQVINSFNNIV